MSQNVHDAPETEPIARVLLVEDNEAAGKGLAKLLQASGFDVTTVFDGAAALEILETDPRLDFVLTDMQLPDLDGREVAMRSRKLVPPPRVALITGWDLYATDEDQASWGIDWVVTKPVHFPSLVERMRGFLPPQNGAIPATEM
ncbi:MAG: hypothetical protein NVSMB9_26290 [Isosphaeraceae bacterium]